VDEHQRTARFAKNPEIESRMAELNRLLSPLQESLEQENDGPRYPVILIIGPPRSGTTLTSQILAHADCFGYISNFVARFWQAPAVGALAEQALNIRVSAASSREYVSTHGVTDGWTEPHEFGYFWSRWFDLGQPTHRLEPELRKTVDGAGLRHALASIEAVYRRPMVYKNNSWCTLQASFLAALLPTTIFVVCRRDPIVIARSLLAARRERQGDERLWWSIRPSRYRELLALPPEEQVVLQALEIEREMDEELSSVPANRIVEAHYVETCRSPLRLIEAIRAACADMGCPVAPAASVPAGFEPTEGWSASSGHSEPLLEAARRHVANFRDLDK